MTFREPEGKSDDYSYARAKEQRIADAYATWKQASRAYEKDHTADVEREDREHRWSKSKTVRRDDDFTPSKRSSFRRETPPKQQSHRKKFSLVSRERSHSRSRPWRRGYEYGVDNANSTTNAAAQRRDCSENGGEEPQYYPRGSVDRAHLPRKRESSRYYRQIAKQEMGDGGDGYYRRDEKLSGDEKYRALEEKSYARQPNIQESSLERQGPTRRQSRSIHDDPRDPQTHTLDALADRQNAPYHKRERCTGDYSRDYDDDLRHRDRTIRRPRSLPYYRDGREQQQYTGVDGADGRIGYDGNDGCGSIAIRRTPSTAVVANGWLHERHRQRSRPRSRSQGPPRQARHAEVSPETLYESERRRERPRRKELVDARDMRGIRDVRYSDGGEERQRDANRKDASGRRLDVELKTDNRRAANAYVNLESSSRSASSASDDDDDECDDISIPETSQERDSVMRSAAVPRVKPPRSAQSPSLSPSSCPSPSPSSSPSSSQSAKAPVQGKRRAAERVNRPVLAVKQRGSIISKSAVVRDRERPETNHKHLEGESDTRCPPSPRMSSPYPPSPDDFELVDNTVSFDDLSVADSASGVRTPDFSPVYLAIACGNAEEIDAGVPIEDTIIADGKLLSPWIPDGLQRMYKQCVALENHSLVLVPTEDHVVEAKQWFSGKTDGPRSLTVFDLTTMTRIL